MTDKGTLEFLAANLVHPDNIREDTFLNSLAYYLITGRKGTTVYQGFGSFLAVCRHPNRENTILIFPEIGKNDGKLTRYILNRLDYSDCNAVLARYTDEGIEKIISQLDFRPDDIHLSVCTSDNDSMDWRYPLHILDTAKAENMEGPEFRNIRQKFRQAEKSGIGFMDLHDENGLTYARAAHKYWLGNQIVININRNKNNTDDFYDSLFSLIKKYPEHFNGMIFFINGKPTAFSIWDTPVNNTVNLIANLADISVKGLSEFQIISVCRRLYKNNIRFLNRGGSECFGLHSFKSKYPPHRLLIRRSAEVKPEQTVDNTIKKFSIIKNAPFFLPSECSFSPFTDINGF